MFIAGLQTLTLLDFPGQVACTVFTKGCNYRCPFCHNASLVNGKCRDELTLTRFFEFLERRKGVLDGVAVTGGEPLLQSGLEEFLQEIRNRGYKIKLDTNGSDPVRLEKIIDLGLVDYVAMDVKNSEFKYPITSGIQTSFENAKKSIDLLLSNKVEYEFRTTVVNELHDNDDFVLIGKMIKGAKKYFLQPFVDSGDILMQGFSSPEDEQIMQYLKTVKQYVPNAEIRGLSI